MQLIFEHNALSQLCRCCHKAHTLREQAALHCRRPTSSRGSAVRALNAASSGLWCHAYLIAYTQRSSISA
eukprot:9441-Heterococcus_DN1.PRE.2